MVLPQHTTLFSEQRSFSSRNELWVSFEKLFPAGISRCMVRLHLQVHWEQETPRGQLGLLEGNVAGLLQESQPNLVCALSLTMFLPGRVHRAITTT